jgi:beta-glucosidase/6-phospho-beta-glucosidase/beta-galactosidase
MRPALFDSFFMAGFECSSHRRRDGVRLDLMASTQHDRLALQDYRLCRSLGMTTIRDGLRWHLIETAPGIYDWSSWTPMLRAAREAGVRVIWDLYHYGSPDFYDPRDASFVDAFARFAAAAAEHQSEIARAPGAYCPVNEISFFAWAVDVGYFGPRDITGNAFKRQLVRLGAAAGRAVRAVDPDAGLFWAEPLIHVAPHNRDADVMARAETYRLAQYEALDMLMGRVAPELGGDASLVDAIGLNFYPHNEWYYQGPTIPMGHHEYRPLRAMLAETYARYDKPLFLAETGAEGTGRPAWLHYVCDEVRAARGQGAEIKGICLYPVTAYAGWDNDRHCEVGLFSTPRADGGRDVFEPLLDELDRQRALLRLGAPAPARELA